MKNIINTTGVNFENNKNVTMKQLSRMNDTINSLVQAVNDLLKSGCDVNVESEITTPLTLQEAIYYITTNTGRRSIGMKIRFLDKLNHHVEYFYNGPGVSDVDWKNLNNWEKVTITEIDGGTW